MYIRFWGTRGSIPTAGARTARYGGNTSCVEVRTDDGTLLVLDCGTGARGLAQRLGGEHPLSAHVLVTHTHWDHIQGFPFFAPTFPPASDLSVYAPIGFDRNLAETLAGQMQYSYFPVKLEDIRGRVHLHEVEEGTLRVGGTAISVRYLNHTTTTVGYRITAGGVTIAYITDHEPFTVPSGSIVHPGDQQHVAFLGDADLVIHDAQYAPEEYPNKLGWGHSPIDYTVHVAVQAEAKRLALFHHDPGHDDASIARLEAAAQAQAQARRSTLEVFAAAEGAEIYLPERAGVAVPDTVSSALAARPVRGTRVLIASNQSRLVASIVDLLAQEGVRTTVRSDPERLQSTLPSLRPHLVILDEDLFDGQLLPAISSLSGDPRSWGAPIVVLSSNLNDLVIRRAHASGATDFVAVPFSPPMLYARLRAWLQRSAGLPPSAHFTGRTTGGNSAPGRPAEAAAPAPPGRVMPARTATKLAALRTNGLFSALGREELEHLARRARIWLFEPGTPIVRQGEPGGMLYGIISGWVRVIGTTIRLRTGEVVFDELGPGSIFGELSCLDGSPVSATVASRTRARCLALEAGDLLWAVQRSPEFRRRLLSIIGGRVRAADERLLMTGRDAVTGLLTRVALEHQYPREAAAARRHAYPLGAVTLEVDDSGVAVPGRRHLIHDDCMRAAADALRQSIRESDLVAQVSRNCLATLLADADLNVCQTVASRVWQTLLSLLRERELPLLAATVRVVSFPEPPVNAAAWIQLASEAGELRLPENSYAGNNPSF